jgi:hypothetical protein
MWANCKYYFQNILKKFPEILMNLRALLGYLEQKAFSGAGGAAFVGSAFHQHNIGADLFDAVPGDYVIFPTADHAEKTAGSRNDDGTDSSFRDINLNVCNKPQPLAGTDAQNFLALQVSELDGHEAFLLFTVKLCTKKEIYVLRVELGVRSDCVPSG